MIVLPQISHLPAGRQGFAQIFSQILNFICANPCLPAGRCEIYGIKTEITPNSKKEKG